MSTHLENKHPNDSGGCFLIRLFKVRALGFCFAQPPPFCFILSLFFIAATLALLGVYVEVDHMPDLDAMKYWNAFVGKLGDKDFCFQGAASDSSMGSLPETFRNHLNNNCTPTIVKRGSCSLVRNLTNPTLSGTVGVQLNFELHRQLVESSSINGIYSTFSGKDIGAQVKENTNYRRIEECIILDVWIPLFHINITGECDKEQCTVAGCLLITAPFTAIPTRMPHVHKDFTFATKVLCSKGRPKGCNCNNSLQDDMNFMKVDVLHDSNCNATQPSVFKLSSSSHRTAKGYGVIKVELSEEDKLKASHHMYLAAIAIAFLGLTFTIGVLLTESPTVPKKSQA